MKPKLKPCPWCGKTDLVVFEGTPISHDTIKCHTCNLYVPLTAAEWNRRSAPSAEEVREACARVCNRIKLDESELLHRRGKRELAERAFDTALNCELAIRSLDLSALPGKETSNAS